MVSPFLKKTYYILEHYSNFCFFEIASFANVLEHYLRKYGIRNLLDRKVEKRRFLLAHNNRFITVNHRHYCSKNYKEPLENREIEGSGERIGKFFELLGFSSTTQLCFQIMIMIENHFSAIRKIVSQKQSRSLW